MSKRDGWNKRYAASDLVWGSGPNRFVAEAFGGQVPSGKALDLACGEGRNAIWLAEQGWVTTGVDFSGVAIERARRLAAERKVEVRFIEADVTTFEPEPEGYQLVVIAYLQIPRVEQRSVWKRAAAAMAPGAEFFGIGHAARNLDEGVGGPQDPNVLWEPAEIAQELEALGLRIDCAKEVAREVEDAPRDAIDVLVRAVREAG